MGGQAGTTAGCLVSIADVSGGEGQKGELGLCGGASMLLRSPELWFLAALLAVEKFSGLLWSLWPSQDSPMTTLLC